MQAGTSIGGMVGILGGWAGAELLGPACGSAGEMLGLAATSGILLDQVRGLGKPNCGKASDNRSNRKLGSCHDEQQAVAVGYSADGHFLVSVACCLLIGACSQGHGPQLPALARH